MTLMIPGAYERNTLTYRQSGSMGGGTFGADPVPSVVNTLDATTIREREREGGGDASHRRPRQAATDEAR